MVAPGKRARRWRVHLAWLAATSIAIGATWWGTLTVLQPADGKQAPDAATPTYTIEIGQVGVTRRYEGDVSFAAGPPGLASTSGTVTSLDLDPSEPIEAGDVLFTIDMRPVIAAPGAIPAYRPLGPGSRGPDVRQLRAFLGVASGDDFDARTQKAVRTWQRELGLEVDGVVDLGELLFLPALPTRAFPADGISVGSVVSAGQQIIATVQGLPTVSITSEEGTGQQPSPGMTARIQVGDRVIGGTLSTPSRRDDGLSVLALIGDNGAPACDASCGMRFPVQGSSKVPVEVDIVPAQEGPVVPDSAISTLPDGSVAVMTADEAVLPVQVVTRGQGLSVVRGVEVGTVVRLFGEDGGQ